MSALVTQMRVGVLMGGLSSEREVSLNSGKGVFEALKGRGYNALAIDWAPGDNIASKLVSAEVEIVWNALHGTYGEDGSVQGLLDCLAIPYTGAGVLASALAMDKIMAKQIFRDRGVPTPKAIVATSAHEAKEIGVPCVVKPGADGSSVGVTIVREASEVGTAFALAAKGGSPVLVEEFIDGAEVNVGILDDEILGSVEIRPATEFYDYQAKYQRSDTQYIVPPELPASAVDAAEAIALAAHVSLGVTAYSRVDLMIGANGRPTVLEVNTLPGMTATSLLPKIAAARGMDYAALCERILSLAVV